jgi:hypothetical protein
VGTDPQKKFTIHGVVVKPRSEFVRLALRGEWKEATERVTPLLDDEPAVFKVYQQWLYSGLIHTREPKTDSDFDEEYQLLAKAYIFGERIVDLDFKDCVADALVEKLDPIERFDPHLTNLIFDNTPSGSPLRRLWMDIHCRFGMPEWLVHITNVEFLVEFGRLQMMNRTTFDGWSKSAMFSKCTYHGHGANPCYRGNPA